MPDNDPPSDGVVMVPPLSNPPPRMLWPFGPGCERTPEETSPPGGGESPGPIGATSIPFGGEGVSDIAAGGAGGSCPAGAEPCQRSNAPEVPSLTERYCRGSSDSTEHSLCRRPPLQRSRGMAIALARSCGRPPRASEAKRSPLLPPPLPEPTVQRHGSLPDEVKRLKPNVWVFKSDPVIATRPQPKGCYTLSRKPSRNGTSSDLKFLCLPRV